jgi:hypothetical protein
MTPESPTEDADRTEAMKQGRAYAENAVKHGQPRRYTIRRLHDVDGLTQREIAEVLEVSAPTVNRDLAETVEPAGFTPDGTPYYPAGRFDEDPEFKEEVLKLTRRDTPHAAARRQVAAWFAGPVSRPGRSDVPDQLRTQEEVDQILEEFRAGKEAGKAA